MPKKSKNRKAIVRPATGRDSFKYLHNKSQKHDSVRTLAEGLVCNNSHLKEVCLFVIEENL